VLALAEGQINPFSIAVAGDNVYWTNYSDAGQVMRVSLEGGAPVTLADGQNYPCALSVSDGGVGWTNANNGAGQHCDSNTRASGGGGTTYWIDEANQAVMQ